MAEPDPYRALGVPPDATPAEVRHAFRRRLLEHHPDTRRPGHEAASDLDLQRVLAAYDALRHRAVDDTAPTDPTDQPSSVRRVDLPTWRHGDNTLRATPVHWVPVAALRRRGETTPARPSEGSMLGFLLRRLLDD